MLLKSIHGLTPSPSLASSLYLRQQGEYQRNKCRKHESGTNVELQFALNYHRAVNFVNALGTIRRER